eukprot:scaffold146085_cov19-Tisochrysis_lutea.AAC.1
MAGFACNVLHGCNKWLATEVGVTDQGFTQGASHYPCPKHVVQGGCFEGLNTLTLQQHLCECRSKMEHFQEGPVSMSFTSKQAYRPLCALLSYAGKEGRKKPDEGIGDG